MENNIRFSNKKRKEVRIKHSLTSNFYLLFTLILIQIFASYSISIAQTLDDYLVKGAENNPGLKSSYFNFEAAMQKTAQVKALPDLALSFGYFVSPVETRVGPQRAKFSLVQMFPWFGTNATKVKTYEFNAQAKYQEFINKRNELYYKIKAAYYPIYEINEHIRWQKENLEILESYKRLSTTNFSNGKSAMVDVIRVDIMIDNAVTELKLLEDKIKPLEITFNRLLNRADSMSVVVPPGLTTDLIQDSYSKDSIALNNPLLKAVELDMQGVAAMEETAKKQGLPTFGVGIDYVLVDKRNDIDVPDNGKNAFMPMVTMSLPLFRKKYNASIKEAQFMRSALTEKKLDLENQLVTSFESEWYELSRAGQMTDLYNQQILKTKQAINLLNSAYANSGKEFEEVLRMEQQLLKYKISKATALKDYFISSAKLNYITAKSE